MDEFNKDIENIEEDDSKQQHEDSFQQLGENLNTTEEELNNDFIQHENEGKIIEDSSKIEENVQEEKPSEANEEVLNNQPEEKIEMENSFVLQNEEEKKEANPVFNKKDFVSKKAFITTVILISVFAILLSSLSAIIAVKLAMKNSEKKVVIYQNVNDSSSNTSSTVINTDLSDIIEKISDSVVEVYTESVSYNSFYGEYVTEGAGSGVIYTSDGYIITNNHVIDSSNSIIVKLSNGDEYDATLVATDAVSDIAVLKIEANNLKNVILGSSSSLKVGQLCIAIGNPLGTLGGTVTDGIISALSREITIDGQKMTLLQTNTSINPGNSGGGLFNAQGQLIGIVNAKSSGSDIEGIGFAIPIDYVKDIAEQLILQGYVIGRPSIGIRCTSIESISTAWNYGVNTYGVYINEVVSEKAQEAGLEVGDVIVGLNDTTISSYNDLKSALNSYSAGDEVTIWLVRGRDKLSINLVLDQKTN